MAETKRCIAKVRINKTNGQRTVTIPKEFGDINDGDLVEIKKVIFR